MPDNITSDATAASGELPAAHDHNLGPNGSTQQGDVLSGISADALKDILQAAGFRVDLATFTGGASLRSATGGMPFEIRLLNPVSGGAGFIDVTFLTHFTVDGAFPLELLNQWNKGRRFARLFIERSDQGAEFLVLCQDLSLAGGISSDHVRAHIVIWDAMVQQLIAWLREELPKTVPAAAQASQPDAGTQS